MFKRITVIGLLLLSFTVQGFCQSADTFKADVSDFAKTGMQLSKAMVQADASAYVQFALISAGIAGITLLDKPVRRFALDSQSGFGDSIFKIDQYYGNKWYMVGGISAIYLGGLLSGNDKIRETGLLTGEALVYTTLLTVATKELFGRSRPYTNKGPYSFKPFNFTENNRSFFSGHSSAVTAVSTVMASRVDNIAWKILWYGAAVITMGARLYHDKHWFSDVTAGSIVGYSVAQFVINRHSTGKSRLNVSVQPAMVQISFVLN